MADDKKDAPEFGRPLDLGDYLFLEEEPESGNLNAFGQEDDSAQSEEQKFHETLYREDMRKVLSTIEGKRVILRILQKLKLFEPVYKKSADIYADAALSDAARAILADVAWADLAAFQAINLEGVVRWARFYAARPQKP